MASAYKALLGMIALGVMGTSADAHEGDQIIPIYAFPSEVLPDLHDGTLADWQAMFPEPTLTEADFQSLSFGDGAAIGAPDLAVNVYLGWSPSQNRIYAAFERWDDVYINTYTAEDEPRSLCEHDCISLMLDGDHSGGEYVYQGCQDFSSSPYTCPEILGNLQAQQYMAVADAHGGQQLAYGGQGNDWVPRLPFGDVGGFVEAGEPHRSVIELMVTPFDDLRFWEEPSESAESTLSEGQIIGLEISLPDYDVAGETHGFHNLSGRVNTWRVADFFLDGLLLGAKDRPTVSAVDSWGRIKYSFR